MDVECLCTYSIRLYFLLAIFCSFQSTNHALTLLQLFLISYSSWCHCELYYFLNLTSSCSLLVDTAIILNSFISSRRFVVDSLKLFTYGIVSNMNKDGFTSSFLVYLSECLGSSLPPFLPSFSSFILYVCLAKSLSTLFIWPKSG